MVYTKKNGGESIGSKRNFTGCDWQTAQILSIFGGIEG